MRKYLRHWRWRVFGFTEGIDYVLRMLWDRGPWYQCNYCNYGSKSRVATGWHLIDRH